MIGVDLSDVYRHSTNPTRIEPNLSDVPLLFENFSGSDAESDAFPGTPVPIGTFMLIPSRIGMYFHQGIRSSIYRLYRPLPIARRLHRTRRPIPAVLC